ncbi:hypothetical protein K438DRAFT_1959985 [Mycena galopus ATCC 62051]|nr:hypothetical protein K438DRAFT_1959985 [Mycena galopus ATCC 62051]
MNTPGNPLNVPELLHRCIHPLRDSTSDLTACALVARAWVYPTQSHLFREVLRYDPGKGEPHSSWKKLVAILQTCPHLIPHVRRLWIDILIHPDDIFFDIISLPFTHLVEISAIITLSNTSALAIQKLINLATLLGILTVPYTVTTVTITVDYGS